MQEGQLGRKRLFTRRSADPEEAAGKNIYLPDLRGYLATVHKRGGWNAQAKDWQSHRLFRFDGDAFTHYFSEAFCKKPQRIYMPLAYTGKVALSLKNAGCDVLASDLSGYWVDQERRLGLNAIRRSFEDLPGGEFDAVVTFEPYPIATSIEGQIGMMRIMARGMPFISIYNSPMNPWPPGRCRDETRRKEITLDENRPFPIMPKNIKRIAYDYGATCRRHECSDGQNGFEFDSLMPTPMSMERIRLDLSLLERDDLQGEASITALSAEAGVRPERMAAALLRLESIGQRAMLSYWSAQAAKTPDFVVTDVSCRMTCSEMRGFVRQIDILP